MEEGDGDIGHSGLVGGAGVAVDGEEVGEGLAEVLVGTCEGVEVGLGQCFE